MTFLINQTRPSDDYEIPTGEGGHSGQLISEYLANRPLNAVADNRVSDFTAYDKTKSCRFACFWK